MLDGDWDTCVAMARDQVKEGAHLIDVCVDYTGADGVADMTEVASRFATQSSVPLMIDSTEAPVVRAALAWIGGRPVLNSVNLEEGDGDGHPARHVPPPGPRVRRGRRLHVHRRGGPGPHRRLEAARRPGDPRHRRRPLRPRAERPALRPARPPAVDRHGGEPAATGSRRSRASGGSRPSCPASTRILGLSNVSFGLNPAARQVLNSVFLHECVEAGLDAAIVHASKILPLARIDDRAREVCLDLVYDRRRDGYDPLQELLGAVRRGVGGDRAARRAPSTGRSSGGSSSGSSTATATASTPTSTRRWPAATPRSTIVNDILLAGMKTVGDLFASGEMQLPFVLQSAETMKAAVAHLEPHMERADQGGKGTVVLATVKGDVHDIGKNLVDIILTNNGYEVVNLGIKVGITEMLAAVEEHEADAIGMSGLLVKSTLIMRENLEELNRPGAGRRPGPARRRRAHPHLRRARPAAGLRRPRLLRQGRLRGAAHDGPARRAASGPARTTRTSAARSPSARCPSAAGCEPQRRTPVDGLPARAPRRRHRQRAVPPAVPRQPGRQGHPASTTSPTYLNLTALFRNQWGFRPEDGRGRPGVQGPGPRRAARGARPRPRQATSSSPRSSGATSPPTPTATTSSSSSDETRTAERTRFTFPRQRKEPVAVHRGLLPPGRVGRARLRLVHARHHGPPGLGARRPELFAGRPLPGLPAPARAGRRDGRGAGRAVAPPHPRGAGLRRRGRPDPDRPVPPAVPRRPVLAGATRPAPT